MENKSGLYLCHFDFSFAAQKGRDGWPNNCEDDKAI